MLSAPPPPGKIYENLFSDMSLKSFQILALQMSLFFWGWQGWSTTEKCVAFAGLVILLGAGPRFSYQLRLVVYPIIYRVLYGFYNVLYILGGDRRISEPSTVYFSTRIYQVVFGP